jgi:hypothetical protein
MPRGQSARVQYWETDSLEDHVSLIEQQVTRSLRDPVTRELARKIVTGQADNTINGEPVVEAWGKHFLNPSAREGCHEGAVCESSAIWNFTVANVAYVPDPDGYDFFATVRYILIPPKGDHRTGPSGDCDDMVILMAALHKAVGFKDLVARVVSVGGQQWEHIYLMVGFPKTGGVKHWVPLDPTVKNAVPGWEYQGVSHTKDFPF